MMKGDVSALQYMRAHGNSPGPTQRPRLVGAISGLIGSVVAVAIRYWSGAIQSEADAIGFSHWAALGCVVVGSVIMGILYAAIFQRAANDVRGGWLFGSCFGFLIWMVGPVTMWQLSTGRPMAVGVPAIGIFMAYVSYGVVVGAVYPLINKLFQVRLSPQHESSPAPSDQVL
jgi:hypothetical protein